MHLCWFYSPSSTLNHSLTLIFFISWGHKLQWGFCLHEVDAAVMRHICLLWIHSKTRSKTKIKLTKSTDRTYWLNMCVGSTDVRGEGAASLGLLRWRGGLVAQRGVAFPAGSLSVWNVRSQEKGGLSSPTQWHCPTKASFTCKSNPTSLTPHPQVDEQVRVCYQQTMREWLGCEEIVRQREKEQHAAALAKCSSGASMDSSSQKMIHHDSTVSNEVQQ